MQIRISGELRIIEIRKALSEALGEIEAEFAIRHSRGAILYINPTDGLGEAVIARNRLGRVVSRIMKDGPYPSAADEYVP
jgi:hypothetical protein